MFARRDVPAFDELKPSMESVGELMELGSSAVHFVGARDPVVQFPRYTADMKNAGAVEMKYTVPATGSDGRLWREVPSRRWCAEQQKHQGVHLASALTTGKA